MPCRKVRCEEDPLSSTIRLPHRALEWPYASYVRFYSVSQQLLVSELHEGISIRQYDGPTGIWERSVYSRACEMAEALPCKGLSWNVLSGTTADGRQIT